MKIELSVFERINLLSLLPSEANFLTLKLIRIAKELLSFSEEEHKVLEFKDLDDGRVSWNKESADKNVKSIELGEVVTNLITEKLKQLDSQGKLRDEHFTLYQKFIGGI